MPMWAALITEDVPGLPLTKIICRHIFCFGIAIHKNCKIVKDALYHCGEWVAKLQEATVLGQELNGYELV